MYEYVYISADPGRQQGGARQGREVVNNNSNNNNNNNNNNNTGFRGYVRQFSGAILVLLRPCVPWCFPVRQPLFEPCPAATAEAAQPAAAVAGKYSPNLHFLPVSEVTLGTFLAQFWCFSVLPCHGVFLSGSRFSSRARQLQQKQHNQQPP